MGVAKAIPSDTEVNFIVVVCLTEKEDEKIQRLQVLEIYDSKPMLF